MSSPKPLIQYGLLGWALGAVAVPIYVQVPYLYSRVYEVPPAWVGIILLTSRLIDALLDPAIGLWIDKRSDNKNRYSLPLLLATPLLLMGMYGVFFPLGGGPTQYASSLMISLIVVHLGYSFASIAYQAWGAQLGHTDKEHSQFVAVREAIGILGVVFAVSFSLETHALLIFGIFSTMLLVGMLLLLLCAPRPEYCQHDISPILKTETLTFALRCNQAVMEIIKPLSHRNFRQLLAIFLCNGLAAALPATLVPFYLRDRLGLGDGDQWVLAVYFLTGAFSTLFWVWLSNKIGLARAWLLGMIAVIPAFVIVAILQKGDLYGYLGVCIVTGFALGADLSLPAALVARLIEDNKERGQNEGTYFGLWNWVNKLNLALAPTLALSTLQWFNYSATLGSTPEFQQLPVIQQIIYDPLLWVYTLLPCLLKLGAIALLLNSKLINPTTVGSTGDTE